MEYYRNVEIVRELGISSGTATNWVNAAKEGKVDLDLIWIKGRGYILKSKHNKNVMLKLFKDGRSKRNKDTYKVIHPTKEFYQTFSFDQQSEIISQLENNRELPNKFSYFRGGAEIWKNYSSFSLKEDAKNTITNTEEMLNLNFDFFVNLIPDGCKVNLIDIGVGDGSVIKRLVKNFIEKKLLNKYIGIDLSKDMLDLAEKNFKFWFGVEFPFVGYVKDINNNSIHDVLLANLDSEDKVLNLVIFVGGTLENQLKYIETLYSLKDSLTKKDYLVISQTLQIDNPEDYLIFIKEDPHNPGKQISDPTEQWLIDNLGFTKDLYSISRGYNKSEGFRYASLKLETDLNIIFSEDKLYKKTINFYQGDEIIFWRHYHKDFNKVTEDLLNTGFKIKHFISADDGLEGLFTLSI